MSSARVVRSRKPRGAAAEGEGGGGGARRGIAAGAAASGSAEQPASNSTRRAGAVRVAESMIRVRLVDGERWRLCWSGSSHLRSDAWLRRTVLKPRCAANVQSAAIAEKLDSNMPAKRGQSFAIHAGSSSAKAART